MLHNLKVGDILVLYNSGMARNPFAILYCVEALAKNQGKAVLIPNLPNGEYIGHASNEIRFSFPRGRVFGSTSKSVSQATEGVKSIRENNARKVQEQEEKEKRVANAEAEKLAMVRSELPELNLAETPIPYVYQVNLKIKDVLIYGVFIVTEHQERLLLNTDMAFDVRFAGVFEQNGRINSASSSASYGATKEDAIYQWIADQFRG